jgi:hypothetical protein
MSTDNGEISCETIHLPSRLMNKEHQIEFKHNNKRENQKVELLNERERWCREEILVCVILFSH